MAHQDNDADLKASFAALRRDVTAGTPAFRVELPEERPWSRRSSSLIAAAAVLVGIVAGIWFVAPNETGTEVVHVVDPGATVWSAPSDFLLDTPGRDLLQRVPRVTGEGISVGWTEDRSFRR